MLFGQSYRCACMLGAAAGCASGALAVTASPAIAARPAAYLVVLVVDLTGFDPSVYEVLVAVGTMAAREATSPGIAIWAGGRAGDGWNDGVLAFGGRCPRPAR